MKKQRKKYEKPLRPWDKERIEKEKEILKKFGLRRKREIWKAEALLRKFRRMARKLSADKDEKKEKELTGKMVRIGLLNEGATLDDVLGLTLENIFERRLQTILLKKGFVNTPKQARQFIVHGKVKINNKKIIHPSYLVSKDEEGKIQMSIEIQKPKVTASEG